jgi:DNA-binding Xre family transcriptional regulator
MLKMNVADHLKRQGVEDVVRYLKGKGFAYHVINRVLMNKVLSINYDVLEKLCTVCGCTPNDLFVWTPDEKTTLAGDHPLHTLKPKEVIPTPVERIKKLPLHKLEKLKEFMDGLERE